MHKMFWLTMGQQRLHVLKLAGSFFIAGCLLKVMQSSYEIFLTVQKALTAQANPNFIISLFGWAMGPSYGRWIPTFTTEDFIGVLLGPLANFMFWMGLLAIAAMVYNSGKVFFPIEEYETNVGSHPQARSMIRAAIKHHQKTHGKPHRTTGR
jgi:hypothetical protein